MENNIVHPCVFRWDIHNPFLPWCTMTATFYSGSPTLTQWKVTLLPMGRGINRWIFSFALAGEQFDDFDAILALLIRVNISIDGESVAIEEEENYPFESRNRHTFYFQTHAELPPKQETPCLTIEVEMLLPGVRDTDAGARSMSEFDQMQLSEDLKRILNETRYSNMTLLPRDGLNPVHVHSYMLHARWKSIFANHSFQANTIQTDISEGLLMDILTYMYSGVLRTNWPKWRDVAYVTELFRAIDEYKLYDLYKVLVKSDSQQFRETRRDLLSLSRSFRLDDRPLNNPSYVWRLSQHPAYNFVFRIKISMEEEGPTLSYYLQSRSSVRTHAQVNLKFVRKTVRETTREITDRREVVLVQESECEVGPHGCAKKGEIALHGDSPAFADFNTDERRVQRGVELQHCIDCSLKLSDGTATMQVTNVSNDTIQSDRERFNILADSMHALMTNPVDEDLWIKCFAQIPRGPNQPEDTYDLHRAIFATRVPAYWRVLRNVPRGSEIPGIVSCTLISEAMRDVLLYIYTGRVFSFPMPFLNEVSTFAQQSEFTALRNLIDRMRGSGLDR